MNEVFESVTGFSPREDEDYYSILGCDELSSKEQITAEYKARVLQCHPDKHPDDADKAKEFGRIQTAKDVLTDDERRRHYDKWRQSGIALPFSKWCNMRDAVHTSMHWAMPKKESMLEGTGSELPTQTDTTYEHHVISTDHHAPGDLGFLRTGHDETHEVEDLSSPIWYSDPPSEMLRKFRNYEI